MSWDGHSKVDLGFNPIFDAVTNADNWFLKIAILQLLEGTCFMDILQFFRSKSKVEVRLGTPWRPGSSFLRTD